MFAVDSTLSVQLTIFFLTAFIIRHYQKELRKQFESWAAEMGNNNSSSNNIKNNSSEEQQLQNPGQVGPYFERDGEGINSGKPLSMMNSDCINGHSSGPIGSKVVAAAEQMKRSDKCLKEMMQTLSTLVLNTDHILKSVQTLGNNMDKDIT